MDPEASATGTPTMGTVGAPPADLPSSVHRTRSGASDVYLVGTAHVSLASVEDVRRTLKLVDPDTVCVELCSARLQNLTDSESWRKLDIFKVLREGKAALLLSSLLMTSFQRRIAKQLGVVPGGEMLAAIEWAKENDRGLKLIDRDIQITLKRTWARLNLWTRMKMLVQLVTSLFVGAEIDREQVEKLKEEGELNDLLESMAEAFPKVKATLIDERDTYLAGKIRASGGERVVAVVGAGHVPGILKQIDDPSDLAPLDSVPPASLWPRVIKWLIPLLIVGLLVYGFFTGGAESSVISIYLWILINGSLAALGTALAFGHPLSIAAAFLAAPLTSLNPMVAAGWVAGLVQAWVKRPTVADLEDLPEAILTVRGFWTNAVCRVLLVVVLANLGSTLGTVIAGSYVAARAI